MQFLDAASFLSLTRNWSADDKLTLQLPLELRTEAIKGNDRGTIYFVDSHGIYFL